MKRTIITTVGTSLLMNWGWKHKQPLPAADAVAQWLAAAQLDKASAETHMWFRLGLFDDPEQVKVVLVYSQTSDGQFCAERLEALAIERQLDARSRRVDGLTYSDATSFNAGLRQLTRLLGEEIRIGQAAGTVELAATGGFKAEIAIANLVGALSETPVHYVYQEFAALVTIEPLPVALRPDWIGSGPGRSLLEAFPEAGDLIPVARIDSLLKQDERLRTLIDVAEVGGENLAGLNLLGELAARLLQAPETTWPPTVEIAPADKKRLDKAAHHRPPGWERIVDAIAQSRYVTSIRYEGTASGGDFKEAADNESDLIHVIAGSPSLTLRISTTATTAAQRRLVQQLLRKEVKR